MYKDIANGDRIVTEPDDIVKMEDEVRRLHKERMIHTENAEKHKHANSTGANLPGVFRWYEDDTEDILDNTTNTTYGTWVWCRNES